MVECTRHYNPKERQIVAPNERVLAHLRERAIQEAFGIPSHHKSSYKTKEDTRRIFEERSEQCTTNFNKLWLLKPRPIKKMPKTLPQTDFKEDYGDIILLLNRIMGIPQGELFQTWMYFFIDEIVFGVRMFNWARMISNNIHKQRVNLESTKSFHMSSYVVYMLARAYRYAGLICRGPMGNIENELKVYNCYPQLQLSEKTHFRKAHDAFIMYITRILQGGTHQRLSHESKSLMNRYGY